MALQVTFLMDDEDETDVTQSTIECIPKIGETIWFVPAGERKACKVTNVCHLISVETNNNYQAVYVYLQVI